MLSRCSAKYFLIPLIVFIINLGCYAQSDTLKEHLVLDNNAIEGINTFSVVELDSMKLAKYFGQTTEELLGKSAGLFIKQYGAGNLATLSIRGSSANQTQVLWNGIPVNSASLGLTDLTLLPIDFYQSLVIQKGGSSLSSGSGGIGGAVCLNSSSSFNNSTRLSAEQVLGSFGIKRTILKFNYSTKKVSLSSAYIHRFAFNNFPYRDLSTVDENYLNRENASINQHFFMQEIAYKLNGKNEFEAKFNYVDSWRQIPSVIGAENNGEFQNDHQLKFLIGHNHRGKKWTHHTKAAFVKELMSYNDTAHEISSNFSIDSYHLNYRVVRDFSKIKANLQAYFMTRTDLAKSDYYNENTMQNTSSAFLKWEHDLNAFSYHFSARQELIDFNSLPITPSIGVGKTLLNEDKWNTEINLSKTSRTPTLNDRFWIPGGNPSLLPERGFEIENNNRVYLLRNLFFSTAVFYGQTANWIIWLPGSNGLWSPENVKEVERYGLETKLETNLTIKALKIDLELQYNFLRAKTLSSYLVNDASINKQLRYVPMHQGQFDVDLSFKRFRVFYTQSFVGKVFLDGQNESYLPYYLPVDFGIDWSSKFISGKQVIAGLKIINLFNEQYHIIANRPMPGAHFLINLKINLKK